MHPTPLEGKNKGHKTNNQTHPQTHTKSEYFKYLSLKISDFSIFSYFSFCQKKYDFVEPKCSTV